MSNRTPLYESHLKAGAKVVDFHGWDMPVNYGSQIEEHHCVRKDAGVFDVSHMTIVEVEGKDARAFLHHLVPNNVDKLKNTGKALYTAMLSEDGGIIDDLIIYYLRDDFYRLVVNSATREKDLAWLQKQARSFHVTVTERLGFAMLAVQGPHAIEKVKQVVSPEKMAVIDQLKPFNGLPVDHWFIARTGYTGEDGLEITVPANQAPAFFEALLKVGVHPCGLGARDTLRLEAGMNLYGQDMDETVTPLESNIGWTIAWEPLDRQFIGRKISETQQTEGVKRILVGILLTERGIPRTHDKVMVNGQDVGEITSGTFSPTLEKGIAFARIQASVLGKHCVVESRGKLLQGEFVKLPFVRNGKPVFQPY
ncbi:MAG: glycine cleavage system protein T [Gammaproteobacteria bacterium GWF2_41_13]|nr:MAG: glycine cleavage system protein T [Gammaproteobacteria bacterium GWF2_41_13]